MIREAITDTDKGAFNGSVSEQICIARAAFALYEYNTDRAILKRIAVWLRYLEIEFESLSLQDRLLYQPADLMELLVRFYQATGMKSVLRICAKLRASAFDWTTALHTFQQSIPIRSEEEEPLSLNLTVLPEELDFHEKEKLINHAELLADGMRYTLFSGLFSGHGQDLSAGKTVWNYLQKHHRALCGGTTANPFLSGQASDQAIGNRALAAWTEAFAAQMNTEDSDWAADELIRIIFNGLDDCLERQELSETQYINTFSEKGEASADPAGLYARMLRATDAAFRHAAAVTEEGIRINYLLSARILVMICKQPVILAMDDKSAVFQCKNPFTAPVVICHPRSDTAKITFMNQGDITHHTDNTEEGNGIGRQISTNMRWQDGDGFRMEPDETVICEDTHHQGVCFLKGNRLLSVRAEPDRYAFTVNEPPVCRDGKSFISLSQTGKWRSREDRPADIPVLPSVKGEASETELHFYHQTKQRITMFPRTEHSCLK